MLPQTASDSPRPDRCPDPRCGREPAHPGGWCAECWPEAVEPRDADCWREIVDDTIRCAGRLTVGRAMSLVNATIRQMIAEPGWGPPARQKKRLYGYGKRRGWVWCAEARGFTLAGDAPR